VCVCACTRAMSVGRGKAILGWQNELGNLQVWCQALLRDFHKGEMHSLCIWLNRQFCCAGSVVFFGRFLCEGISVAITWRQAMNDWITWGQWMIESLEGNEWLNDWITWGQAMNDWITRGQAMNDWITWRQAMNDWITWGQAMNDWIICGQAMNDWITWGQWMTEWLNHSGASNEWLNHSGASNEWLNHLGASNEWLNHLGASNEWLNHLGASNEWLNHLGAMNDWMIESLGGKQWMTESLGGNEAMNYWISVVHLTLDGVNGKWRWRRNSCQIDGENSKLRRQSSEISDGNAVIYDRYLRCHSWMTPYVHNTGLNRWDRRASPSVP